MGPTKRNSSAARHKTVRTRQVSKGSQNLDKNNCEPISSREKPKVKRPTTATARKCKNTKTVNIPEEDNPLNWTTAQLRERLSRLGISVPNAMKRTILLQLFLENNAQEFQPSTIEQESINHSRMFTDVDRVTTSVLRRQPRTPEVVEFPVSGPVRMRTRPVTTTTSTTSLDITEGEDVGADDRSTITEEDSGDHECAIVNHTDSTPLQMETFNTLVRSVGQLSRRVDRLFARREGPPDSDFVISNSTSTCTNTGNTDMEQTTFRRLSNVGVASDSVPHIDVISSALRKNIVSGKNINLASLLIPDIETLQIQCSSNTNVHQQINDGRLHDPRLNRSLTLAEFITAFSKYRNVMCEVYPQRRKELDDYERDIVAMATRYGGGLFYEYHKAFSARAATLLVEKGIKVNWGIRDNNIYCTVMAGHRGIICSHCSSTDHTSQFCPFSDSNYGRAKFGDRRSAGPSSDIRGRPRVFYKNREVCNNFNTEHGCKRLKCSHIHVCLSCKKDHSQVNCGK